MSELLFLVIGDGLEFVKQGVTNQHFGGTLIVLSDVSCGKDGLSVAEERNCDGTIDEEDGTIGTFDSTRSTGNLDASGFGDGFVEIRDRTGVIEETLGDEGTIGFDGDLLAIGT